MQYNIDPYSFTRNNRSHPDSMRSQFGVIQLACAALEALDHKGNHHRDKMYATEKVKWWS